MKEIITGGALALVSAVLFALFSPVTEKEKQKKDGRKRFLLSLPVYIITDIISAFIARGAGVNLPEAVSLILAANFIFLLGAIDLKHRRIPNAYVGAALVFRTVFIFAQGIAEHDLASVTICSICGFAAGGLITGLAYVISHKGIGSGDVKMFAVIGYFAGGVAVIDILVYSTLFCCICGIVLLVTKKCGKKDSIPMAPFAYAGTMLYIIAGM
ncbi:A24 family peptidase [Ruminococcus sp. HUN007]|uniref:prepilin peptidase n=1 Tax=Ruminococcus sp. HUN007 TaxID=1514668 RepID=UPI000678BEFA|nr:A24 family peptidase [Ruminococcus sp. HUN007]